jgi:methionyl-tRNA synthetase
MMPAGKRFYITTPIYYVTAKPHIGTSYTTIACDVLARSHRLRGEEVLFATGVDEHAQKVVRAAEAAGVPVQEFVDRYAGIYRETWAALHVEYDRFIRTTEPVHKAAVQEVFRRLLETGDIYKGEYRGWYCVPCETYFPEAELKDGNCPDCGRPVEELAQPAYFFRLSAYAERLQAYIEQNPGFIQPESRRNEVLGFIRGGLQDVCVSRTGTDFGVLVPGDEDHVVYVWFDALINYLTIAGYPATDASIWPPDVQVMGKDILPRFHATIWPAVLLALGEPLPRALFGHGWWVSDRGDKMSKSRGNIVDPLETAAELAKLSGCSLAVAVDTVRYFLLREVHFGLDGSFSLRALLGRFNADLANDLGNLLNRTLPLIDRYLGGTLGAGGTGALAGVIEAQVAQAAVALEALDFRGYLEAVWELLAAGNKFVDEKQPWALYKQGDTEACGAVLYDAADLVRIVATLVQPVMPEVSAEIWRQLGLEGRTDLLALGQCRAGLFPAGTQTQKGAPIFPRVDLAALDAESGEKAAAVAGKERKKVETIKYEQFAQLDLRAGKVLDVAPVPESDKLFQLTIDLGEEEPRTVVAGLAGAFGARELLDAYVVVVANLEPAKIRGVVSNGMVLAVGDKEPLALVTVDRDVPPGAKVR